MKIATLRKFQTRLLRRRNKAQREYRRHRADHWADPIVTRLDSEVTTLDKVLDDLARLIANNHDRFHDRRKKNV